MSNNFTTKACASRFSDILRQWTGDMRNAAKRLGRRIGSDPRAVENYIYGRSCPPAVVLIELMAECQELADEVNKMVAERRANRSAQ